MGRQVFVLLPASEDGVSEIAIQQDGNSTLILEEQYRAQADDIAVAFAPATAVTAHKATILARNEKEAFQSAPYTIEDELAEPVEKLHVALGSRRQAGQQRDVYVVSAALMENWKDRLDTLGLGRARIVPELSVVHDTAGVLVFSDRCLVSVAGRRYGVDLAFPEDLVRALTVPNGEQIVAEQVETHSLLKLAELLPEDPVDLRQGRFARKGSSGKFDFRSLALPVGLVAACFVVWVSYLGLQTYTLNSEATRLRTEASSQYAALFPEEGTVPDAAQRIREKNAGAVEARLDFRTAAAALYEATLSVNGAQIRSLRYDGNAGTVRASLTYAAYGDDARLRQVLEESGLAVQVGDSRQEQGRVIGDLILEAAK